MLQKLFVALCVVLTSFASTVSAADLAPAGVTVSDLGGGAKKYSTYDQSAKVFCSVEVGKGATLYTVRDGEHGDTTLFNVTGSSAKLADGSMRFTSTVLVKSGAETPFVPRANPSAPHIFVEHCKVLLSALPEDAKVVLTPALTDEDVLAFGGVPAKTAAMSKK